MSFERLVEKVRNNDVVLWVGSGFSLYAGMPSANTLRDLLIEHSAAEDRRYFENKNLADVASTFIDIRMGSKNDLYQFLQSAIDVEPISLKYHQLLTEIPQIDLIVTTNYDKLFEEAYGRDISSIVTDLHLPLATKRTKLYKIHGDIHMADTMVLTNEDYTNFFRNQDKPLWNKIKTLLAEKTIIFLGYSLADQNIQYLFDNVIRDIGSFIKEPYLIAPDLSKHEINRLTQKRVNYVNMSGEEFIEKLHDEIKKKLLIDILKNKVDKKIGLDLLVEKYNLKTTIHETADGSFIKSLGSDDRSKRLNLNMKFEGINFFSLLRQSYFKPFEISGENIKAFETHFEGITIPNGGKIQTLTVIPLPSKKFKADMFLKGTYHILSDVLIEVFEGFGVILLRFTHNLISFELNFEEKKFNFKINKFRHLRELEDVVDFLLTLLEGIEPLMLYINETFDGNDSIENKEYELLKMSMRENIENRAELIGIKEAILLLKEVQKHYGIMFRNFELNLPDDFKYALDVLRLHMEKSTIDIEKLYFEEKDIIIYEDVTNRQEFIQELTENKKPFNFEYRRYIDTLTIFNQIIPIHDELIIRCTDAIISKRLDKNEEQLNFELYSSADGIVMGFL